MKIQLNRAQLTTIVAALRHWKNSDQRNFKDVADHLDKPLSPGEIDELCEFLNFERN